MKTALLFKHTQKAFGRSVKKIVPSGIPRGGGCLHWWSGQWYVPVTFNAVVINDPLFFFNKKAFQSLSLISSPNKLTEIFRKKYFLMKTFFLDRPFLYSKELKINSVKL